MQHPEIALDILDLPVAQIEFEEAIQRLSHSQTAKDRKRDEITVRAFVIQNYSASFMHSSQSQKQQEKEASSAAAQYFADYTIGCLKGKGSWKGLIHDLDQAHTGTLPHLHKTIVPSPQVAKDKFLQTIGVPFVDLQEYRYTLNQEPPILQISQLHQVK